MSGQKFGDQFSEDVKMTGMTGENVTLLVEDQEHKVDGSILSNQLFVNSDCLESVTGWHLEDRGLCKNDRCIPVQDGDMRREGSISLAAFADTVGRPYAEEINPPVGAIGPEYKKRQEISASDKAPDFTLPDLNGNEYSLSDFEGNKIFLLVWASW